MLLSEQYKMMAKELRDIFDHPDDDRVKEAEEEECLEREQDAEEVKCEAEVRAEQEAAHVARQEEESLVIRHNSSTESARETGQLRRISTDIH